MKAFLKETFQFALIALFIVLPIRYFVAQPFIVSGESMIPTFQNGNYLIVDEISYRFSKPERGDVIILKYPLDPKKYFIKRIIGLPGETVEIDGNQVTIKNETGTKVLEETYIEFEGNNSITKTLGAGEYYVLGDNRAGSADSRVWGILPEKNIVGKALVRLFPLDEIELYPGAADLNAN